MANWKYKIELKPFIKKYKDDKIPIEQLAKQVAVFLRKQKIEGKYKERLDNIADYFEQEVHDVDAFDRGLEKLYDWGDTEIFPYNQWPQNRLAWINTM